MKMLFEPNKAEITEITSPVTIERNIRLLVLRLDKIHPVVSGNKLFKLHFFLEEAFMRSIKTIVTFGGAYSNHLHATAYACKLAGLNSVGIVRGEQPANLSHTLVACIENDMQLIFVSREKYAQHNTEELIAGRLPHKTEYLAIPEGGYHPLGAKGAALIMNLVKPLGSTHICTAVGTATTIAGLLRGCDENESIIAVPVLKNMHDINERIKFLNNNTTTCNPAIFDGFHFGGYAKRSADLISFMNNMYERNQLPTDFVYTGKMMFAIMEKIKAGYFKEGSIITCLHTGGLQGNASLKPGTLVF